MPIDPYPTLANGGPKPLYYRRGKRDWEEVSYSATYEDGGQDWLNAADDAPRRLYLRYGGLEEAEAQVLIDHNDDAKGPNLTFSFTEPRDFPWTGTTGETYTVRYEKFTFDHEKIWTQEFDVVLVVRP